ncbi:hypothetical protein QTP88_011195 [Uroleucon formosanum]
MSKGLKYSSNLCPLLWGSPSIIQRLSQIQTAPERTIFNQKQQANRNPRLLLNFNQNQHHSRKYFPPLCQPQWSTSQSTTIQNLPNTHSSHPKKNQNPTEPCTPSGLNSISNIYKINSERYENNITKLQSTNGSLWRKTKNIIKLKELIPPIKLPNNKLAISDLEKSNTFAEYFYEVFKPNNINPPINQNKINQSLNSALHTTTPPKHFTPNEIKYTISKLKNGKAPGHDSITNNILKKLTNKAILNITHIFNAMLRLSYFPPLWKISTIILVHKPGKPKNTTSSYRPIGLLPSLEITEAFSHCRNIKLPSDVKEIAELNFGILFSLELPNKLTKEEFTQKSLEEKIELLSVPKSLYLYYFLSKDDLIQILRFFNKEFSKNSETIELRLLVRSILNRNQSEDDNDSDPDFIPKPFNIEQRSPVITAFKKERY